MPCIFNHFKYLNVTIENLPLSTSTSFEIISIENFSNFFKVNVFTYFDKAIIKPSCCEVSCS